MKTRAIASPGSHPALAAHRSATPAQRIDPGIAEAVERQAKAMRELSRRAFPEPDVVLDDAPALIEAARAQRRRPAAAAEAAALRRARWPASLRSPGGSPLQPRGAVAECAGVLDAVEPVDAPLGEGLGDLLLVLWQVR
ncbi:hypothetical protein [Streptomyces telluris]|uniref:Uncharacterized protein n=1 Tax=Streptomyces telluris TaxID=2720021 RepID=A0A9X2RML8_9ACTN|nr:hypothetical protein [Streptomyces telluris]MCQ8772077.1 hypothetical protein [Streptomyces telluris]